MKNFSRNTTKIIMLVVGVIAVVVITNRLYFRVDVTEDNIYTLSEGSLAIANKLDQDVIAKLYFSKSMKDMPVMIKQYGTRVEEVLREYAAAANGKLTVEVIDPKPDTDDEEWAIKYGVRGVQTQSGDSLYLGVVFLAGETEVALPYLDPRKEEFLEYDLSEALVKLKTNEKPKLSILTTLPVMGGAAGEKWVMIESLESTFDVEQMPTTAEAVPDGTSILFLIHPKDLSDPTLFAIDQFVMKGGRLVVAVDPFSRVEMMLNPSNPMMGQMPNPGSDLNKLFKAWDVGYDSSKVVGDSNRGTPIAVGGQNIIYPFFMTMQKSDFATDNKITNQLRQVLYAEGGALDLAKDSSIKMEPLLSTSAEAGTIGAMMLSFQPPADTAAQFRGGDKQQVLAATYQGKFKSAFSKAPGEGQKEYLDSAKEDGLIAVFADVDFMHDSNAVNKLRFGPQTIVSPRNDNLNLVLNTLEFLGGNEDLISIRSSGTITRPFTKVLEIQKIAQIRWQAEEKKLSSELQTLQDELSRLQDERTDGNRLNLSPEQEEQIKKFRDQETQIRRRLREVRKNLREDIESLGHRLIAINLLATPALVAGFGIFMFRSRSRKEREEKKHG